MNAPIILSMLLLHFRIDFWDEPKQKYGVDMSCLKAFAKKCVFSKYQIGYKFIMLNFKLYLHWVFKKHVEPHTECSKNILHLIQGVLGWPYLTSFAHFGQPSISFLVKTVY